MKKCNECKHTFHLNTYIAYGNSCPMCRSNNVKDMTSEEYDALMKAKEMKG
jgi:Zn finger protein HypA/HybF involved in hydrogenase expression